jgi:hypothetical protein
MKSRKPRTTFDRLYPAIPCARCGEDRWPSTRLEPYTCQRCRETLAGDQAVDPLGKIPTPAQKEAGRRLSKARQKAISAMPNRLGQDFSPGVAGYPQEAA